MTGKNTPPTRAGKAAKPPSTALKRRQPTELAYRWEIGEDRLHWGHGAARFLGVSHLRHIKTGQAFAERLRGAPGLTRTHAILFSNETDDGHGVPYRVAYGFHRQDGSTLWLHDTGRWFAGRDGRPAYAEGLVRLAAAPSVSEREPHPVDFLSLVEQDCASLPQRTSAALMAFMMPEAEIGASEWLTRLRCFARHGDRIGWVGRMLILFARACPDDVAPAAAHRIAESLSRDTGVPIAACAIRMPRDAQTALAALQAAEHHFAGPHADQTDPLNRALRALNTRTITMALQPIVAASSRQVVFHEALARIPKADGLYEPTEDLVAALEAHGSIALLDHRILSLAIDTLETNPTLTIAVNVAPRSLADADWFRYAEVRLSRRRDLSQRLIFEITEQADWAMLHHHRTSTDAILAWGARLALDDFGTGRTSLRHLTAMKTSFVKIAGPFVQNITRSIEDRQCVGAMIDLARHMGLQTIAEWVEDEATAHFLEARGINFMQGRLFGAAEHAPVAHATIRPRLRSRSAMG